MTEATARANKVLKALRADASVTRVLVKADGRASVSVAGSLTGIQRASVARGLLSRGASSVIFNESSS